LTSLFIELIDLEKGEGKAHACDNGVYNSFFGSTVEMRVSSRTMKRLITTTILALVFFPRFHASATTCVATKPLKVKQVCGKVTGPFNAPVAGAEVGLLGGGSEVSTGVRTDDRGDFIMPNVPSGQFEIEVKSAGYVTAAQQLIVTKTRRNTYCHTPVHVQLHPGSLGCSVVTK
jgi:Carboxypeptidase regulatory-like domain